MSWKPLLSVLALLLPFALSAAKPPVVLRSADDGKTIGIKVGDRFDVSLAANATTGYGWEVAEGTGAVIRQLGEPGYQQDKTDGRKVGVGGTASFHFEAAAAGTAHLKLVYRRPWEKDKPPAKSFEVTVVVSPA